MNMKKKSHISTMLNVLNRLQRKSRNKRRDLDDFFNGYTKKTIMEPLEPRMLLSGTTFTVNSLADNMISDNYTTLREAVAAANANNNYGETDIIVFDSSLSGETITLTMGQLDFYEPLEIQGLGQGYLTISGNGTHRVFENHSTAEISDMTITDGYANYGNGGGISNEDGGALTLTNITITDNSSPNGAGGVYNQTNCDLTISHCTITENTSGYGSGGGILNYGSLTVAYTTISNNTSTNSGGSGIFTGANSTLVLSNSTISGNTGTSGGGLSNFFGAVTISSSTISGNTATTYHAGGVENVGSMTITDSVVSNNSANTTGGGVRNALNSSLAITNTIISGNSAGTDGGGIYTYSTNNLAVINSLICGNVADNDGGGIFNDGTLTLTNTTVAGNTADNGGGIYDSDSLTLENTVVAINHATSNNDIRGTVNSNLYSFIGTIDGDPDFVVDPTAGVDGIWGTSDDTEGDYHLDSGSDLIDAGSNALAVDALDQTLTIDLDGETRIVNSTVDIGAYEFSS